jgi:UDP-glucose 4-epimerase
MIRDSRSIVIVTGGAGFVGSELVRQLAARGDRVVIIDNLVNGSRANVAEVLSDRVVLVEADIRDLDAVKPYLAKARIVFHLAVLGVRHSVHSPYENHDVNATATLRLLEASRDLGVPRFVYVSSSEVYGTAKWAPMTEDHPTFPCTVYGASKLAGECYTRAYYTTYHYPTVIVRPFNTYGPRSHHEGDSGEVVPKFLLRCMADRPLIVFGDGTQTRDFQFVSDTAAGIILAGEHPAAIGQTFNLGSGSELTINELARVVSRVAERPDTVVQHDRPRPGDVLRLYADMSHAQMLLGYEPKMSIEDGLRALLEWYRAQPESPEELLEQEIVHNWKLEPTPPAAPQHEMTGSANHP